MRFKKLDLSLQKKIYKMEKIIKTFDKVRAYAYSNKLPYEFDFQPESLTFRVDYLKRVDDKFEEFLKGLGFEIDVLDDEDCGQLFSYNYVDKGEKVSWYEVVTEHGNTEYVRLYYVPELDEQFGDDIIMVDKQGNQYPSQSLLIIREI